MTGDDEPRVLSLPSADGGVTNVRGGPREQALSDFRRRVEQHQPLPVGAIDARRGQLIAGIYALDRGTPISAAETLISGAIGGTVVQVLFYGLRHWYDESRAQRRAEVATAKPAIPSNDGASALPGGEAEKSPSHPSAGGNR